MKCAFYGRYSTDMQREASIEDQLRICVQYARREAWEISLRFEDKGVSGASKARPGYQAMLQAARDKEFEVLLIDDLSRLSRDNVETQQVLRRFRFMGIRIIAVSDGFDSTSRAYKIQAGFKGLMNDLFLDDLAEKTRRGLTGQALKGNNCGGRSYGYRHVPIEDPSRLDEYGRPLIIGARREIDPEQARWVRKIFRWYADGYSPRWIASELNRLKVPSPRAAKSKKKARGTWAMSTIYGHMGHGTGILNNPLYVGKYIWNRSQWIKDPDTGKRCRFERPESEWVVTELPELRIVPQDLWERVKARQRDQYERSTEFRDKLHAGARTGRGPKYLFSGLLKCGVCGGNYVIVDTYRYGCAVHKDRGEAVCDNTLKVSRKVVEERILAGIKDDLFTPEAIDLFMSETRRLLAEHRGKKRTGQEEARKRLEKAEQEIRNIMAAIKAGIVTPTTKAELEKVEAEKREMERVLAVSPKADKVVECLPRAVDRYKKLVSDLPETLQRDVTKARGHLRDIFGEISLVPEGTDLVAEIKGDYAGLLALAAPKINVVAGRGFEPLTFGL